MSIMKILGCLVIIGILMSATQVSVLGADMPEISEGSGANMLTPIAQHQSTADVTLGIYVHEWNDMLLQGKYSQLIEILEQHRVGNLFIEVYSPTEPGAGVLPINKHGDWQEIADEVEFSHYWEDKPTFDLNALIEEAHDANIEVHAVMRCFGGHPVDTDLSIDPEAIDPDDPEKTHQQHLLEVVNYLVGNFDLDGIQLDYVRYTDQENHTNDTNIISQFVSNVESVVGTKYLSAAVRPATEDVYDDKNNEDNPLYCGQDYSQMSQHLDSICPMAYHISFAREPGWVGEVTSFVRSKVVGQCKVSPIIQTDETSEKPEYEEVRDAILSAIDSKADGINIFVYGATSVDEWCAIDEIFLAPDFIPLDLCMVLDRSWSMNDLMENKTKIQGVKDAATGVVNVLLAQDRVSIVSFSTEATTDIDFTCDFTAVKEAINQLSAGGNTSFGAGLAFAVNQFANHGNPGHIPVILFMSDGLHNTAPKPDTYVAECKNTGIPIFTVGFASTESEVDVARLQWMADETGGEYHFVADIFDLQNIFLELHHTASGWESIATYVGEVNQGETINAGSFQVDPSIKDLRVTLNWPGSDLDLKLLDPNNTPVDFSSPEVTYSGDTKPEYVIIKDPQPGTWTVEVYGKVIGSSEDYYVLVTKYVPPEQPPAAYIDLITPNPANQGTDVVAFAGHGVDPDGTIVAYHWKSSIDGDIGTSSLFLIPASSLSVGSHTIFFEVQDNDGTWSIAATDTLIITGLNQPPYEPGNPLPANQETNVPINADLSWEGADPDAGDALTYDVYFGTGTMLPLVSQNQTATTYDPGALEYNTEYYWKIVAQDDHGASTEGPIWKFISEIGANILLDPGNGHVGMVINVKGTNFTASKEVSISYDGAQVATVVANASGDFLAIFNAPPSEHGNHVVKATDGTNTLTAVFIMESNPPPIPKPLFPLPESNVGFVGRTKVTFEWSDVKDESDVTYILEVGRGANFANIVVRKTDLHQSHYTLTEEEALEHTRHTWRVRAIDGAGNASEWTDPCTFMVGRIDPKVLIIIIVLASMVLAAFIVWRVRKKLLNR